MKIFSFTLSIMITALTLSMTGQIYAEKNHETVVRENVKRAMRNLEKRCAAKAHSLEIGYLDGWKKSDEGAIWGRHYFLISMEEDSLIGKEDCVARELRESRKLTAELAEDVIKGFAYTRETRDGILLVKEKDFSKASGEEYSLDNLGDTFKKKTVPFYVDLDMDDVEIANITAGERSLAPSNTIKIRVVGTIKTNLKWAEIFLEPEVKDLDKKNRHDIIISEIHENANAKLDEKQGSGKVKIIPNKKFDFVVDIQAQKDYKIEKPSGLYLTVFLNGKKNHPIVVPLENKEKTAWYTIAAAGVAAAAVALAGYFFFKGRGVRHEKYDFSLKIISGPDSGKVYSLNASSVIAGRLEPGTYGIAVNSEKASRKHAVFTKSSDGYAVTDSRSTNGTFVNGIRISEGVVHALNDGDEVKIANISLLYSMKRKKRK